jgi:hypothetical protein
VCPKLCISELTSSSSLQQTSDSTSNKRTVSLAAARANAAALGHKPYRKPIIRTVGGYSDYHTRRSSEIYQEDHVIYDDDPISNPTSRPSTSAGPSNRHVNQSGSDHYDHRQSHGAHPYESYSHRNTNTRSEMQRAQTYIEPAGFAHEDLMLRRVSEGGIPMGYSNQHEYTNTIQYPPQPHIETEIGAGRMYGQLPVQGINHLHAVVAKGLDIQEQVVKSESATETDMYNAQAYHQYHEVGQSFALDGIENHNMYPREDETCAEHSLPHSRRDSITVVRGWQPEPSETELQHIFDSNNLFDVGRSMGLSDEQVVAAQNTETSSHVLTDIQSHIAVNEAAGVEYTDFDHAHVEAFVDNQRRSSMDEYWASQIGEDEEGGVILATRANIEVNIGDYDEENGGEGVQYTYGLTGEDEAEELGRYYGEAGGIGGGNGRRMVMSSGEEFIWNGALSTA